jgi:hypothetical protein
MGTSTALMRRAGPHGAPSNANAGALPSAYQSRRCRTSTRQCRYHARRRRRMNAGSQVGAAHPHAPLPARRRCSAESDQWAQLTLHWTQLSRRKFQREHQPPCSSQCCNMGCSHSRSRRGTPRPPSKPAAAVLSHSGLTSVQNHSPASRPASTVASPRGDEVTPPTASVPCCTVVLFYPGPKATTDCTNCPR